MVIVFALLVYGLERNHYRQQGRRPRAAREMLGSTDVEDRDLARMRAEFRAITANQDLPAPGRGRPHTSRVRRAHVGTRVPRTDGVCGAGREVRF
jgi:hypothetical protein